MPAPLAMARLLGAGALSATEITLARINAGVATMGLKAAMGGPDSDEPEDITIPVASTAIRSIGWRRDGIIIVEFNQRGTYTYDGTYELFQAFVAAPSKGGFFNRHFK